MLTDAPAVLNRIRVGPAQLKSSITGGETPNAGVLNHGAAPTPIPPAALVWPYDVPLLVANCGLPMPEPKSTYFTWPGNAPAKPANIRLNVAATPVVFWNVNTSTASP